jgi:hypothetical protein
MSLPYILFELTLFDKGNDPTEDRTDLGWLLEALVQRNMAYLKANPGTPRLYESGVVYERPAQFGGVCPEVGMIQWALDPEKAKDPRVQAVVGLMQMVFGGERFRDIGVLYSRGKGDCDNLASARVAELRQAGIQAKPLLIWRRRLDGGFTYHVLVSWPDGSREDPSLLLGMGGESRKADRDEEIKKNLERTKKLAASLGRRGVRLLKIPNVPGLSNEVQAGDPFAGIDGGIA